MYLDVGFCGPVWILCWAVVNVFVILNVLFIHFLGGSFFIYLINNLEQENNKPESLI